jgi:hypothetical protein
MRVSFGVDGVPPKKDGSASMWRKSSEVPRIKALRLAASAAFDGISCAVEDVSLTVRVYASRTQGDLDNFATGICDGLMAVHVGVPVDATLWADLPPDARPERAIAFVDDGVVSRLLIERLPVPTEGPRYEIELEWVG